MIYSLFKRGIFFSSILIFMMCKTNNAQGDNHPEQIINAQYHQWFGGVKGVKGIHYEFYLKSSDEIIIQKVVINNIEQPFAVNKTTEGYFITVDKTSNEQLPTVGEPQNTSHFFELYQEELDAYVVIESNSYKNKKIKLPRFQKIEAPLNP